MDRPGAEELRAAYWDGDDTLVTLGAKYGCSPGNVARWMKKYGIPTRSISESRKRLKNAIHESEVDEMVRLYAQGLSSNDVGRELGRAGRLVRTHLKKRGVLRPRNKAHGLARKQGKLRQVSLNEEVFKGVLTPDTAWVLGLIYGDGHVQRIEGVQYGVHLAGTEQVCAAASAVVGHGGTPKRIQDLNVWRVGWHSKTLVESLLRHGLSGGSKATTMTFPEVPDVLLSHFVRGLWDSDGSWQVRGAGFRGSYYTASRLFAESLYDVLRERGWDPRLYERHPELNGKVFTGWCVYLKTADSRALAAWLYKNSASAIRCARKHGQVKPTLEKVAQRRSGQEVT
jgi:hypothetical protein